LAWTDVRHASALDPDPVGNLAFQTDARKPPVGAWQFGKSGCLQFNLGIEEFLTGQDFPRQFAQFFYQLRRFG
jgi:hypothetical protein